MWKFSQISFDISSGQRSKGSGSDHWAVLFLTLTMLLSSLGVSIANVALPTLGEAFNLPFQWIQWVVLSYLLGMTSMAVCAGYLGDMFGHRTVLLFGVALFLIASLFCAMASSLAWLIVARSIQGAAGAVLIVLSTAFIRSLATDDKAGRLMGLVGAASAIGTALGPSLGGMLLSGPGWRSIFLLMAVLSCLSLVLGVACLPKEKAPIPDLSKEFDLAGSLLMLLTLVTLTLALTVSGGGLDRENLGLFGISLFFAVLLWRTEKQAVQPIVRMEMLKRADLSTHFLANAVVSSIMMATLVVGPYYLSHRLALSTFMVGLVMSTGPLFSVVSGVPAGLLVDRFGARHMVFLGLSSMIAGVLCLSWLPEWLGVVGYILALALLTPGYQLFQAANTISVLNTGESQQRGILSGWLSLSRNIGLIGGASLMGAVFARGVGMENLTIATPALIAEGMQLTFVLSAALLVVSGIVLKIGKRRMSD